MIAREEVVAMPETGATATATATAGAVSWSFASPTAATPASSTSSAAIVIVVPGSGMDVVQRYEYTGRELASESSGYYFRFRVYGPELGQFFTRDPAGYRDGMSLYAGVFARRLVLDHHGLAECDCRPEDCKNLKDFAGVFNKLVQQAIDEAIKGGKSPAEALVAEGGLGWGSPWARIETLVTAKEYADYIKRKTQDETKYRGVKYGLWRFSGAFPVLNPCILLCGQCVGSDKLGHFLQQGAQYYNLAKLKGRDAAEKWSHDTEYIDPRNPLGTGGFGQRATGVASEADMEANRRGGAFYTDLATALGKGVAFQFDICGYVSPNWSEETNPNQYVPEVGGIVKQNLLNR